VCLCVCGERRRRARMTSPHYTIDGRNFFFFFFFVAGQDRIELDWTHQDVIKAGLTGHFDWIKRGCVFCVCLFCSFVRERNLYLGNQWLNRMIRRHITYVYNNYQGQALNESDKWKRKEGALISYSYDELPRTHTFLLFSPFLFYVYVSPQMD
jgi:hypothetical protein